MIPYTDPNSNRSMPDLSTLTDAQLENLEDFCTRKGRDDLHDQVIAEMLRRPDFSPTSYDLMYLLMDAR
jgi:hypothetical protein